jgi:hypothetical protein
MRTLKLDVSALQVETFTTRPSWAESVRFADTDDADCDAESGTPDCETVRPECLTDICLEPPEDC